MTRRTMRSAGSLTDAGEAPTPGKGGSGPVPVPVLHGAEPAEGVFGVPPCGEPAAGAVGAPPCCIVSKIPQATPAAVNNTWGLDNSVPPMEPKAPPIGALK